MITTLLIGYYAFVEQEHYDTFCDIYRCYTLDNEFVGKVITNDRRTAMDYFKDRIEKGAYNEAENT